MKEKMIGMRRIARRAACVALAAALSMSVVEPYRLYAETRYLPEVTAAMSQPSYWSQKMEDPGLVLADSAHIMELNQSIVEGKGTGAIDLSAWDKDTYDGVARNAALKKDAQNNAEYGYNGLGAKYKDGVKLSYDEAMEQLYGPLIENCEDPDASKEMQTGYAICTSRTTLRSFPTDQPLPDDPSDPDFDTLYLSGVAVGEPMVIRGKSKDGKYYCANTEYLGGWVPAEDIAFCKDRAAWLSAWHFDSEKTLVVCGDRIYTENSNYAPQTSARMLPRGTCLEIADRADWEGRINNRFAYHNYVVWLPIRLADGTMERKLALISERSSVSEGYLPVTADNLSKVMLGSLGSAYGWGGMLNSQDCSGYVRDVYRCFGMKLARNTTQQAVMPVKKYDLTGKTSEERIELIKQLPLGTELLFTGHAMLYLGHEGDKLYVVSSVSNLVADGVKQRVRGNVINTLDIKRANGISWLDSLHTAAVPYLMQGDALPKQKGQDVPADPKQEDKEEQGLATDVVTGGAVENEREDVYVNPVEGSGSPSAAGGSAGGDTSPAGFGWGSTGSAPSSAAGGSASSASGTENGQKEQPILAKDVRLVLGQTVYTYTGDVATPDAAVYVDGEMLDPEDYTVRYQKGRKAVGTYRMSVKLQNGYEGSAAATFQIIPKGAGITGVKVGKKTWIVRWKKQSERMAGSTIDGYQLQYASDSGFTKNKKTLAIKKSGTGSKKIAFRKKGQSGFVRIRTYMTVGGETYYSEWSKGKKLGAAE